eukprot:SAG25_NODE_12033_length_289_cov_0.957895_1_plen_70_part_10
MLSDHEPRRSRVVTFDRLALEIRCSMWQLAVEATHAKLGAHFGLRAARLAAAATRLHECPAVYEDSQHKL